MLPLRAAILMFLIMAVFNTFSMDGNLMKVNAQPFIGFARLTVPGKNVSLFQTGIKLVSNYNSTFLLVDNNYHHSKNNFYWPGVGDYSYSRTINTTGFCLGKNFFSQYSFGFSIGMKYYYSVFKGKLHSDNEQIKLYVEDGYTNYAHSFVPFIHFVYRINKPFSVYGNFSYLKLKKGEINTLIGLGFAYNIFLKEKTSLY